MLSRWKASTTAEEMEKTLDVMFWFDRELKQVENVIVDDEGIKPHLVGECRRVVDIRFDG